MISVFSCLILCNFSMPQSIFLLNVLRDLWTKQECSQQLRQYPDILYGNFLYCLERVMGRLYQCFIVSLCLTCDNWCCFKQTCSVVHWELSKGMRGFPHGDFHGGVNNGSSATQDLGVQLHRIGFSIYNFLGTISIWAHSIELDRIGW